MNEMNVLVAPRELKDQIEKASRVIGCEASVADRLAEDVTFCEINYGQGIPSWFEIANLDAATLNEALGSSFQLRLPPDTESTDVYFDSPILFVLLARTLHNQESCGVTWSCDTEVISGNSKITSIHLRSNTLFSKSTNRKMADALSNGLTVPTREWEQLSEIASQFLMPEEILDAS